jgi:FKBP-type peptidyl-prolyl cis-trans isomerase
VTTGQKKTREKCFHFSEDLLEFVASQLKRKGLTMKRIAIAVLLTMTTVPALAAEAPKTEEQKVLYAVGQVVGRQLAVFNLSPVELAFVQQGISDSVTGAKPAVEVETYGQKIQELANSRRNALGDKLAAEAKNYLDKAAKEKGAVKTASGLIYLSQKEGSGAHPSSADKVKVNYRGLLVDGTEFDSSYKRGKPVEFQLAKVIKCWTEGVQMMKPGGKARLVCPPDIAYGEKGAGTAIPPNATLVFEVELLEVNK